MKALQDDEEYDSRPGWNRYTLLACSLAEANLLIREGKIGFLPLIVAAAETNVGQFYKMPGYNDFNAADIYFYRSPIGSSECE